MDLVADQHLQVDELTREAVTSVCHSKGGHISADRSQSSPTPIRHVAGAGVSSTIFLRWRPDRPYMGSCAVPLYNLSINYNIHAWSYLPEEDAGFCLRTFHGYGRLIHI